MIDQDRNSEVIPGGSMSVTKLAGTKPDDEGRKDSVGLMSALPMSDASYVGGTAGAVAGVSNADLKQGFVDLGGKTTPDFSMTFFDQDNSGEVDQRKPWNDPDKGFLTRPMGSER